jgi:hypothetical protein
MYTCTQTNSTRTQCVTLKENTMAYSDNGIDELEDSFWDDDWDYYTEDEINEEFDEDDERGF